MSFIGQTLITTNHGEISIDEIAKTDLIKTTKGYRKAHIIDKGFHHVNIFNIGDNIITCTPDTISYTSESYTMQLKYTHPNKTIERRLNLPNNSRKREDLVKLNMERERVYDIIVEGTPEYFANNVLFRSQVG